MIAELDRAVRRGYLVYAGHPLGTDAQGRAVTFDRDVLVERIDRTGDAWSVVLREIHVRRGTGPAA